MKIYIKYTNGEESMYIKSNHCIATTKDGKRCNMWWKFGDPKKCEQHELK